MPKKKYLTQNYFPKRQKGRHKVVVNRSALLTALMTNKAVFFKKENRRKSEASIITKG